MSTTDQLTNLISKQSRNTLCEIIDLFHLQIVYYIGTYIIILNYKHNILRYLTVYVCV